MTFLERIGGRKLLLTLLVLGTATAVELCTERGITEAYGLLLAGLVGMYSASNVAITRGALNAGSDNQAPQIDTSLITTVGDELADIKATVNANAEATAQMAQLLQVAAGKK